jgi:hypothetical protein
MITQSLKFFMNTTFLLAESKGGKTTSSLGSGALSLHTTYHSRYMIPNSHNCYFCSLQYSSKLQNRQIHISKIGSDKALFTPLKIHAFRHLYRKVNAYSWCTRCKGYGIVEEASSLATWDFQCFGLQCHLWYCIVSIYAMLHSIYIKMAEFSKHVRLHQGQ